MRVQCRTNAIQSSWQAYVVTSSGTFLDTVMAASHWPRIAFMVPRSTRVSPTLLGLDILAFMIFAVQLCPAFPFHEAMASMWTALSFFNLPTFAMPASSPTTIRLVSRALLWSTFPALTLFLELTRLGQA